ncbi:MAG: hypothetical protein WC390_05665 [Sulfurimonas sp.]|jgi:hypothetical protein
MSKMLFKSSYLMGGIIIVGTLFFNGCAGVSMSLEPKNVGTIKRFPEFKNGANMVYIPSKEEIKTVNLGDNLYEEYYVRTFDTKSVFVEESAQESTALHIV